MLVYAKNSGKLREGAVLTMTIPSAQRETHMRRVLVTGPSGTLGYNIVRHIARKYPATRILAFLRHPDPNLFGDFPNVAQQRMDITDTAALTRATLDFQPNAIVHCAATGVRPSNISWFDVIDINVSATVQLFRISTQISDCHFVHISTGLVYSAQNRPCHEGDPVDTLHPYGASKAASDSLLRAGAERLDTHLTVVRPFSFTGLFDGGNRLFPTLLRCATEGTPMKMSSGVQMRDFCAVQDVAEAICLILEHGKKRARKTYNVGSGLCLPLRAIVESIVSQLGLNVDIRFGDLSLHPYEPLQLVADLSLIRTIGWEPKTNLAHAVWDLARNQFPDLQVKEPKELL